GRSSIHAPKHPWEATGLEAVVCAITQKRVTVNTAVISPVPQRGLALIGFIRLAVPDEGLEDLALVIVGTDGADIGRVIDESRTLGVVIIAGAAAVRELDRQDALLHEIPGGIERRNSKLLKVVIDIRLFHVREYEHDPGALAGTPVTVVLVANA